MSGQAQLARVLFPWNRTKARTQETSCVVVGSDAPRCRAAWAI
jgi:hypothetical protein